MEKQLIISVGREFGSGGHVIAEALAGRFGLPLYDYNLLREITIEKDLDLEELEKYDEQPKRPILYRTVRGYSNSPAENIAKMQFDFLRKKAAEGESFVVVGRCSETILKGNPGLITIFVLADMDEKIKRIMEIRGISEEKAIDVIKQHNKKRKAYHNNHSEVKWGDSRNYDLSVNSSKLGIERTTDMLEDYIKARIGKGNW